MGRAEGILVFICPDRGYSVRMVVRLLALASRFISSSTVAIFIPTSNRNYPASRADISKTFNIIKHYYGYSESITAQDFLKPIASATSRELCLVSQRSHAPSCRPSASADLPVSSTYLTGLCIQIHAYTRERPSWTAQRIRVLHLSAGRILFRCPSYLKHFFGGLVLNYCPCTGGLPLYCALLWFCAE